MLKFKSEKNNSSAAHSLWSSKSNVEKKFQCCSFLYYSYLLEFCKCPKFSICNVDFIHQPGLTSAPPLKYTATEALTVQVIYTAIQEWTDGWTCLKLEFGGFLWISKTVTLSSPGSQSRDAGMTFIGHQMSIQLHSYSLFSTELGE